MPLSYQTCSFQGKESKLMNRWKIEYVEYIETDYLIPHRGARAFMHSVYQSAKLGIEQFIVQIIKYNMIVKTAEMI